MKTQQLNNGANTILAQQPEEVKRQPGRKTYFFVSENYIGFNNDVCVFTSAKQAFDSIANMVEHYATDTDLYARVANGRIDKEVAATMSPPFGYRDGVVCAWEKWTIEKTHTSEPPFDFFGKVETYFIYREHGKDGGVTVTLYDTADGENPNTDLPVMVRKTKAKDQDTQSAAAFAALLRAYEQDTAAGVDTTASLLALAQAVALSVVKKCIDPQRKSAPELEKAATNWRKAVSNNGISPALTAVRRGIMADIDLLDKLTAAHNAATALQYNKDGDLVSVVVDEVAEKAATALQGETLSDGIDLVNAAVVAILEQTAAHAESGAEWMEKPYTMRRLCRKVLIRAEDTAAWEEVETSPIQEVYRAVRREVQNSRAVQTDPRNGYLYIEDTAADPDSNAADTIYRRLQKWADLGGYTTSGHYDAHGNAARSTTYTANAQTAADYESIVAALNLTAAQATFVNLRMRGYGHAAIATYMGVSTGRVYNIAKALRVKCGNIGFDPAMWAEMTAEK